MANNAKNAVVGKPLASGGLLIAPLGTTLPTDEATAPAVAFVSPGYLTDQGVTRSEKKDSETKKAWGGDALIVIQKDYAATAKFGFAEYLNSVGAKAIYGDANVTTTAATSTAGTKMKVAGSANPSPHRSWIIDMISGTARIRVVFPDAQITDLDDVVYKDDDISARGVGLTLFPDSSGNYFYEYTNDGVFSA